MATSLSSYSSEELEVFICFKLLCPLLTNSFSTGDSVTWSLFLQEAQVAFIAADEGTRKKATKETKAHSASQQEPAAASLFSEGHTGTPIIVTGVAGAFPKLHL
jgi:hypothetical protein